MMSAESGAVPSATPREPGASSSGRHRKLKRRKTYDIETFTENEKMVELLKYKVKTLDERKAEMDTFLRSARTSQWSSKQECDQLTSEFRQLLNDRVSTPDGLSLLQQLTAGEAQLKSLTQQEREIRDNAIHLANTCDQLRENVQSTQMELDMLRSRFMKTIPHVAGEVFVNQVVTPEPVNKPGPPPPRFKPQLLPCSSPEIPLGDFSREIAAFQFSRIFRKISLRVALKSFCKPSSIFMTFAELEISSLKKFLERNRGGKFLEISSLPDSLTISMFMNILNQIGYPTPGAVTAAFARGGLRIDRKFLVSQLTGIDCGTGKIRPKTPGNLFRPVKLENFDFKNKLGM